MGMDMNEVHFGICANGYAETSARQNENLICNYSFKLSTSNVYLKRLKTQGNSFTVQTSRLHEVSSYTKYSD